MLVFIAVIAPWPGFEISKEAAKLGKAGDRDSILVV